jgi:hypothetical protein
VPLWQLVLLPYAHNCHSYVCHSKYPTWSLEYVSNAFPTPIETLKGQAVPWWLAIEPDELEAKVKQESRNAAKSRRALTIS